MSQYLNVHIRDKDGKFHYLTSYSRSTAFYQVSNAPYEKVRKFTYQNFEDMILRIEGWIKNTDIAIQNKQEAINFLKTCNRSMDEVLEQFRLCQNEIRELEFEKRDYQYWIDVIRTFGNIVDDIESDCEVYMGIEISEPTEADIVAF